jgi:NAD(P)H-dependent FMN reductase
MPNILIISASVRTGRNSHRVALFLKKFIEQNKLGTPDIADLNEYKFPVFDERLKFQKNPTPQMLEISERVKKADGVIIVTPEYNGGYPASLKNIVDLLYDEWHHKPIAISTVSNGSFGGTQVITSLQFSFWKIRALTVTAMFPVPNVDKGFAEDGTPGNPEFENKRATGFVNELLWFIKAVEKMKN